MVKLGALKPRIYPGALPLSQAVASGELAVGSYTTVMTDEQKKGAPVEWRVPAKAWGARFYGQILKTAPHPNAAKLFMNFVFSDEAVAALEKAGFSVGERQAGQMKHEHRWEWKLKEIKRYFSYQSTLAAAYRALKFHGAKMEPEKSEQFKMAESE